MAYSQIQIPDEGLIRLEEQISPETQIPKGVVQFLDLHPEDDISCTVGDGYVHESEVREREFVHVASSVAPSFATFQSSEGESASSLNQFILCLGKLQADHDPKILRFAFPNLFPFRQGGVEENHATCISRETF